MSVLDSDLTFFEWCTFKPADKKFVLQCQAIISEESKYIESHN